MVNLWTSAEHALRYLEKADQMPHRTEGEAVLLEHIPKTVKRILDLGTGDGRLLGLLKIERPHVQSVAIDFSPTMLEAVKTRFADDSTVQVIATWMYHYLSWVCLMRLSPVLLSIT